MPPVASRPTSQLSGGELAFLPAVELAAMIRGREVSPVEVTRAVLERIDRYNCTINAIVTLHAENALSAAANAEDDVMKNRPLGALHGVPFHVKDDLRVAGSRTTFGSELFRTNVTTEDSPVVERLRKAGMIVVGRTNAPEFGWKGVTDNRVFGVTRNPWNPALTPGGSSGGAAAAVAAGFGPIGLGTDGGGSLRIPASFCGVFGFKPTFGRVPCWPGSGFALVRHHGAITRTVSDMAAALDQIVGPDSRDLFSLPAMDGSFATGLDDGVHGRRVAYSPDLGYARVEPEVASICRAAIKRFAATGVHVDEVSPGWIDPYQTWSVFFFGATASRIEAVLPTQGHLLDPGLRKVAEEGLKLRGVDVLNAFVARQEFWDMVRSVYERFDLLTCPTLTVPPFRTGQNEADPINGDRLGPLQWPRFSYPFNLTGQPAATVPAGWTKAGLPVGLQIVGNRGADRLVLQAARAWEQLQPWSDRRPPLDSHSSSERASAL